MLLFLAAQTVHATYPNSFRESRLTQPRNYFLSATAFASQVEALRTNDVTWERVRSNVDHVVFKSGKRIVLLAEGRLLSLAATSIPSMVTSVNSCTQVSVFSWDC